MNNNLEVIDNSNHIKCWSCKGKGCKACDNTGLWKEPCYFMIYTDKDGNKMAFQTDFIK